MLTEMMLMRKDFLRRFLWFADVGDGVRVATKLFGNVAIVYFSVFVGGKQDVGVFDLLSMALAGGDKGGEGSKFFCGQSHFVNLSHIIARVRTTRRKDSNSAKSRQEQYP